MANGRHMIGHVRGKVLEMLPTMLLVEVNGLGYEVIVTMSAAGLVKGVGSEVSLYTHLAVREDAHVLYGFSSRQERDLFRMVIGTVSGIGPKIGMSILSSMSVDRFRHSILFEDVKVLSSIPGVGKKTAERLIVELRDKLGISSGMTKESGTGVSGAMGIENPSDEAVLALIALQMKPADALSMVEKARKKLGDHATTEELVKACLQRS